MITKEWTYEQKKYYRREKEDKKVQQRTLDKTTNSMATIIHSINVGKKMKKSMEA